MSFDDVMPTVMQWVTASQALSALAAELSLKQAGTAAPPEIADALRAVTVAAGIGDLDELTPQQQMLIMSLARLTVHEAKDLLDDPARPAGWTFTDPVILDGWGRASMMVPPMIAGNPELASVERLLDVGTGVGLFAVSAATVWPGATVVGVDQWEPSLERARANVAQAGLEERIELRRHDIAEITDVDEFDCIWVPTFFLDERALEKAVPALVRALRPGGWIVLGRSLPPPVPLLEAASALRTVRNGGTDLDGKRAVELLEGAGCVSVHAAPSAGPAPMELLLGQKPAGR